MSQPTPFSQKIRSSLRPLVPEFMKRERARRLNSVPVKAPDEIYEMRQRHDFFWAAFKALQFNGISGDYMEFGCHSARTFAFAYHESRRRGLSPHLWACDSFEGLPPQEGDADEHPEWQPGHMATSVETFHKLCELKGIDQDAYTTIEGFYSDTLPPLGQSGSPTDVCLAYIDCDLHSSTSDVLDFLMPRLKHGMILAFDDYFCWSATQVSGERHAMLERFHDHPKWRLDPYLTIGWHGHSFVVEDRELYQRVVQSTSTSASDSADG